MQLIRKEVPFNPEAWPAEVPTIIQQIYANRSVLAPADISKDPTGLLNPHALMGMEGAVDILVDAIKNQRHVTIAGDYDCDGATGTAVGVRGLILLGLKPDKVKFTMPNRDIHGYGLTVGLVDDLPQPTSIILTVDSGIASNQGVAHAKEKGYTVVITDHHLPGDETPIADAIVNPNQRGDTFPSKAMAGVGVMFYTLLAVRARLKKIKHPGGDAPLFHHLAPIVAIGTVADLVPLDHNNRILVDMGLRLIQADAVNEGIRALMMTSNIDPAYMTVTDIGFRLAPRLNAAGRLADMTLGVKLLLCDDRSQSIGYAKLLEEINNARKDIQGEMVMSAESIVRDLPMRDTKGIVVYNPSWHHGVVGLVASKLKESMNRPVVAFALAAHPSQEARGSARSIPGLHLRDALALVDTRHPGLLVKFGGHAMAAGMTVMADRIPEFEAAFLTVLEELVTPEMLTSVIVTDGELEPNQMTVEFCKYLEVCGPWGQGFPRPIFDGIFEVKEYKILGEKHIKFELYDTRQGDVVDAIWFFSYKGKAPPTRFRMAYELSLNVFRGREKVQLMTRHIEPIT